MRDALIADNCNVSLFFEDNSTVQWTEVMVAEDEKNWYLYNTEESHQVVAIYNKDYVIGLEFTSNYEDDEDE